MRQFLKGLDLDEETIDTIMAEYGKNFEKMKEENESLNSKCKQYESDIEKLNGEAEQRSKQLEQLQNVADENGALKAELELNGSGVRKEFSKFVTNEIMAKVDEQTDFATALGDYKKSNPQYFGEGDQVIQSAPNLNATAGNKYSTNDIMNNILRSSNE